MLALYESNAPKTSFLTGFFKTPIENFHASESIEFDIIRNGEQIAYAIHDLTSGPNKNEKTLYTNKEFIPPLFDEEISLSSFDLQKRMPGDDPFMSPVFQANAARQLNRGVRDLDGKILRAIEEMSSQVLQTGMLNLNDKNGQASFSMDFKPKSAHFPTVGTSWSSGTADIQGDINSLCEVVRNNGKIEINTLIMGDNAFFNFQKDALFVAQCDNRRFDLGFLSPEFRGNGQAYQGQWTIGGRRFDIFTYGGRYENAAGSMVRYLDTDKVIFLNSDPSQTVLDLSFGSIPRLVSPDPRVAPFIPQAFGSSQRGMRLSAYGSVNKNGTSVDVSVGTRPLPFPKGIDTFACLDTEV